MYYFYIHINCLLLDISVHMLTYEAVLLAIWLQKMTSARYISDTADFDTFILIYLFKFRKILQNDKKSR